jgi:hypothetical protein
VKVLSGYNNALEGGNLLSSSQLVDIDIAVITPSGAYCKLLESKLPNSVGE